MLTSQDIQNLTKYIRLIFREELGIHTKTLQDNFSKLQTSVDAIAKDKLKKDHEITSLNSRMKNAEDWIDKAAPKIAVEFEH